MKKLYVITIWAILALIQISTVFGSLKEKILLWKSVLSKRNSVEPFTTKDHEAFADLNNFKYEIGVKSFRTTIPEGEFLKILKTDSGKRKNMESALLTVLEIAEPHLCRIGFSEKQHMDELYNRIRKSLDEKGLSSIMDDNFLFLLLDFSDLVKDWGLSGYEYFALLRLRVFNLAKYINSENVHFKYSITDMLKYLTSVEEKIQQDTKERASVTPPPKKEEVVEESETKEKDSSKPTESDESRTSVYKEKDYTKKEEESDIALLQRLQRQADAQWGEEEEGGETTTTTTTLAKKKIAEKDAPSFRGGPVGPIEKQGHYDVWGEYLTKRRNPKKN